MSQAEMDQSEIKKGDTRPDTKQRILDAAEKLFAREGFHNTSLRAITGEAEVNLAAVNYHFGSKEALLDKVIARRLLPLNELRRTRLLRVREASRRENRRPRVEETLRAFIEPTMRFRDSEPGADDFMSLIGRALSEPDDTVRKIFITHIKSIFYLLYETLCNALPDISKEVIFWRLQFSIGALSHILRTVGRFELSHFPEGVNPAPDTDAMLTMLVPYLVQGMEAH